MYVKTRISALNKKKAEKIVARLGLDMSSYIRICVYQLIENKAFPFTPHLHGATTEEDDFSLSNKKKQAILDCIDEDPATR